MLTSVTVSEFANDFQYYIKKMEMNRVHFSNYSAQLRPVQPTGSTGSGGIGPVIRCGSGALYWLRDFRECRKEKCLFLASRGPDIDFFRAPRDFFPYSYYFSKIAGTNYQLSKSNSISDV